MALALVGILLAGCRVSNSTGSDVDATVEAAVEATLSALDTSGNSTQIPGAAMGPPTPNPTRVQAQSTAAPEDGIRRVSAQELKAMVDAGEAIVVDSRAAQSYKEKHIAGAISIPWNQMASRYTELPTDKHISFY
jgi:3-mercaptopyruvate sulfurtransferase SseA